MRILKPRRSYTAILLYLIGILCFVGAASLPIIAAFEESSYLSMLKDQDNILFKHLSDNERQEMILQRKQLIAIVVIAWSICFIIVGSLFFFLGNLIQKVWNIDSYLEHIAYNTHSNIPERKPSQREFQKSLAKFAPKGHFDKKPDEDETSKDALKK